MTEIISPPLHSYKWKFLSKHLRREEHKEKWDKKIGFVHKSLYFMNFAVALIPQAQHTIKR